MECVSKDEEIRKLRFQLVLNEDENDALNDELEKEMQHSEDIQRELDETIAELEQMEMESQRTDNELRLKTRELDNMKVCVGL